MSSLRVSARAVVMVLGAVVLIGPVTVIGVDTAAADGSGPTNFESVLDSVDPPTPAVRVEVVGGDSFLQVTADRGTGVEIAGYDGEPYLRISPDGIVERNELSAATYLNATRDGTGVDLPDTVDSGAEPRWERIGDGGQVAWHDHRIHWMGTIAPTVGTDELVQVWSVPLVVDGETVDVSGRLLLHGDRFPWAGVVAVATAVGAALAARRPGWRLPLLAAAATVALAIAVAAYLVDPPDVGTSVVPVVLPALALALAGVAQLAPRLVPGPALPLASVAALAGWAVVRIGVMWMPVIPTEAPEWVDRAGTAIVLGVAVGVAVAVLVRPGGVPRPAVAGAASDGDDQRSSGRSPSAQSDIPPRS